MVAAYFKKGMLNMIYVTGVYSTETTKMFLVDQVSGLVENSHTGIYSDTIYVINVKLCIELYLFIPLSVTLTVFQGQAISNTFN